MGDTRHLAFVDEHYVQKRKSLKTDDVVLETKSYQEKKCNKYPKQLSG